MHYVILHTSDSSRLNTMLERAFPGRKMPVDTLRRTIDGYVFKVRDLNDEDLATLQNRVKQFYSRDIVIVSIDKPIS